MVQLIADVIVAVAALIVAVADSIVGAADSIVGVADSIVGVADSIVGVADSIVAVADVIVGVAEVIVGVAEVIFFTKVQASCLLNPLFALKSPILTSGTANFSGSGSASYRNRERWRLCGTPVRGCAAPMCGGGSAPPEVAPYHSGATPLSWA